MVRSWVLLPVELLGLIADQLEVTSTLGSTQRGNAGSDIIALSSTCKIFRKTLEARLFRHLSFTNQRASCTEALGVIRKHGKHTMSIRFLGQARSSKHAASRTKPPNADELLCSEGRELLSGTHTPNATYLTINWDFKFGPTAPRGTMAGEIAALIPDDPPTIRPQELEQPWRGLSQLVWQSVAQNTAVQTLTMTPMLPMHVAAFDDPSWLEFLGRLRGMSLHFPSAIHEVNAAVYFTGYLSFATCFHSVFLLPAKNLESLMLTGPKHSLVGHQAFIIFSDLDLPSLRSLRLVDTCLSQSIMEFLVAHRGRLTDISLQDVWACEYPLEGGPIKWSKVFHVLGATGSTLETFEVLPDDERCYKKEDYPQTKADEEDQWSEYDKAWKESEGKRLFPYAAASFFAGPSNVVDRNPQTVLGSLREGDDQKAYDNLKSVVTQNKARRGQETHGRVEL